MLASFRYAWRLTLVSFRDASVIHRLTRKNRPGLSSALKWCLDVWTFSQHLVSIFRPIPSKAAFLLGSYETDYDDLLTRLRRLPSPALMFLTDGKARLLQASLLRSSFLGVLKLPLSRGEARCLSYRGAASQTLIDFLESCKLQYFDLTRSNLTDYLPTFIDQAHSDQDIKRGRYEFVQFVYAELMQIANLLPRTISWICRSYWAWLDYSSSARKKKLSDEAKSSIFNEALGVGRERSKQDRYSLLRIISAEIKQKAIWRVAEAIERDRSVAVTHVSSALNDIQNNHNRITRTY